MNARQRAGVRCISLALLFFGTILCCHAATAATYFVSQSGGNDSNTGTSQGQAWKTLTRLQSVNLLPGDSVSLKRGDVWRESLIVLKSGTEANPLTFGAYGSGALPVIDGTDTLTAITSLGGDLYRVTTATAAEVLVLNGVVGRRVANQAALTQQADWFPESGTSAMFRSSTVPASVDVATRQFGIVMNQVSDVSFSNISVRYAYDPVWIYNAKRVTFNLIQVNDCAGYAGYFFSADAAGFGSFNSINECIVTNQVGSAASRSFGNNGCGIFVYSTGLNNNNSFTNNLVSNSGHEGIALLSSSNNLIAGNSVSGSASAGIRIAGNTSANNVIEYNESFGNCNLLDDRFGIDLLDISDNNIVRFNFVHEQGQAPGGEFKSGGIRFDGGDFSNAQNQTSVGNKAYYNVVFGEYIGIDVFNASNIVIDNNTVVDCTSYAIAFNGVSTLVPLNNSAFNNVVRMLDEGLFFENGVAGSIIDYNVYQSGAGSFFVSSGAFHTWDTWRNQRGFDVHGKMGELALVNPAVYDFRLTAVSPAVDAGTPVGLTEDFNGTAVPQGGAVDAGAYEFIPPPAPVVTLGTPSVALTRSGPVDFPVTYTGATTINLLAGNVTLNTTGTASGTVSVLNGATATPTVRVSSITGNGTLGISIAAGTATNGDGNPAPAAGPSTAVTIDNTAPTISIGAPSAATTKSGPVDYSVTYSGANSVSLLSGNVTLNKTGTANGTVSVINGTSTTATVRISSITGDGTLGISIAAGTTSDTAGNTAASAGPGTTFSVDNTAPSVSIGAPSATVSKSGPVDYTITYGGASSVSLLSGNVTLNKTGTANGTVSVLNGTTNSPTVRVASITGNGTLSISIAAGTASDAVGNTAGAAGPGTTFTVDNTAPTVSIGSASASLTRGGPVDYVVTYSGANTINLLAANVTLNKTSTANGTVSVLNGTSATPTVRISGITGNGTLGISIAAATASDTAGNTSAAAGPSGTFTVDNTAPTLSIGAPSSSLAKSGPVDYSITYSGANTINLQDANVTLAATGTASGSVSVLNGTTASPTVRISGITGDGTLSISIASGTASDTAGNSAPTAGPGSSFTVDNTPPVLTIGAPSSTITKSGPVDYAVSYTGASTFNLLSANVTLNKTGIANGSVTVLNGTTSTPTVRVSGITGDGTLGISIAGGTASDAAGNSAAGAGPASTITVDNTAPTVSISLPSVFLTNGGPADYSITYSGATTITLLPGNVTLNKTGTANGSVSVLNGTTSTPTVRVSGIIGDGTLGISIAAGTASDGAGNTAASAGPTAPVAVDNIAPTVGIGAPSAALTRGGPVDYPVSYTGASSVSLSVGNITLNTTGDAAGTLSVLNGTTSTPTVRISGISGDGSLGISIAPGTASDNAGNAADGATPSTLVDVDNTAPSLSVGTPSASLTRGVPVDFFIIYTGASVVNLLADDVSLIASGTASGSVSVLNGTTTTPTVRVSGITGDGTLGISIAAGTASDEAANPAPGTAPSVSFTVDNTAPALIIGEPSTLLTRGGPVDYAISYSGAESVNLTTGNVSLLQTGTAVASVEIVNGATSTPTVRLSSITGDGTLGVSIAAGTASDAAGNTAPSAGPGTTFVVDNTAPGLSIGAPSVSLTRTGPVDIPLTYSGADSVDLSEVDVTLQSTGTATGFVTVLNGASATPTVRLTGITGNGSLAISVASGSATDAAGNLAPAAGPSANATVDNTEPTAIITQADATPTNQDTVRWLVDFSESVEVTFTEADLTVGGTLAAGADVTLEGPDSGDSYLVSATLQDPDADGTLSLTIGSEVEDAAGNPYAGGTGAAYTLVNIGPGVSIGTPDVALTRGGPVTYTISYTDAASVSLSSADVALNSSGTATGVVSVSGTGNATRVVSLSSISGDGTLGIALAPGTALDVANNPAPGAGPSATVAVDNTPPLAAIAPLDATPTNLNSLRWQVDFSESVAGSFTEADVLPGGSLAGGAVNVQVSGPVAGDVYSVTLTPGDPNANGTLSMTLGTGITDAAGNAYAGGSGPAYTVQNIGPTVSIGTPSVALTRSGPVEFVVNYANATAISLAPADITLNTTGTASGAVSVNGAGSETRIVTISGITGDGTLGISIAPGSAIDAATNSASGAGPSASIVVDNTAPTALISRLDPSPTALDVVRWSIDFSESVAASFASDDISVTGNVAAGLLPLGAPAAGDLYVVGVAPLDADANGTLLILVGDEVTDAAGNAYSGGAGDPYVLENVLPEGAEEGQLEGVAEGTGEGTTEGTAEGTAEGVAEGQPEGQLEGTPEGLPDGTTEGIVEGATEGTAEGVAEGAQEGVPEGTTEGVVEGLAEGSTEGVPEGIAEGSDEGAAEGELPGVAHTADRNNDKVINLSELLRVIQLFNQGGLRCSTVAEDGYDSGVLPRDCTPHAADYNPQDWRIRLNELLRVIQFYNADGYRNEPGSEDGFLPGR